MGDRLTLAERLIDHYERKAVELLMDYLRDDDIRTTTERYMGQHAPSPKRPDVVPDQSSKSARSNSFPTGSSSSQRPTRQNLRNTTHGLVTPSNSGGSVRSHSSSLAAAGLQIIHILPNEGGKEVPVMSRTASVKHSLIGDNLAYGRVMGSAIEGVDETVSVPVKPGGQRNYSAKTAMYLTWRPSVEFKTRANTFFIVPASLLDSDVILGNDASEENQHYFGAEDQEEHSPQDHFYPRQGGFVEIDELGPAKTPRASFIPTQTYEQSSMLPTSPKDFVRGQASQRLKATQSNPRPMNQEPSSSAGKAPDLDVQPGSQLYMGGRWDKTPINICFDPTASGEEFYQEFLRWAVKRKRGGDLQRHRTTIWLKSSKIAPDEHAYELSLREEQLETWWEETVEWIQENKSEKAPHIYAIVEQEPG